MILAVNAGRLYLILSPVTEVVLSPFSAETNNCVVGLVCSYSVLEVHRLVPPPMFVEKSIISGAWLDKKFEVV